MNVTPEQFKVYWETFFRELELAVNKYLPAETHSKIKYMHLMPCKVTAIVSSQFGVGAKFMLAETLTVEAISTPERIEDVILGCPMELLKGKVKYRHEGSYWQFKNISLKNFLPFRLTKKEASIAFSGCLFEVGDWNTAVCYTEVYGNNDYENWSPEMAKNRAYEIVLVCLYDLKQAVIENMTITDFIAAKKKNKSVLLLGDYHDNRLEIVKQSLLSLGYRPILLKDLPDIPDIDLLRKASAIGFHSRFVVIEDSSPSGHLSEAVICEQNRFVTILLRGGNKAASYTTVGSSITNELFLEKDYDPSSSLQAIEEATQWAEAKLSELKRKLDLSYPWRNR